MSFQKWCLRAEHGFRTNPVSLYFQFRFLPSANRISLTHNERERREKEEEKEEGMNGYPKRGEEKAR